MGGAIGAFFVALLDGIVDAIGQKKSNNAFEQSLSNINSQVVTAQDYECVLFKFHQDNDGDGLVKYIELYRNSFEVDNEIMDFFEAKGLFLLGKYEQAKPMLEKLHETWKESKIPQMEEVEVIIWLAIIYRKRGDMIMANKLREEAIKKDRKYGTGIGIKSLPW